MKKIIFDMLALEVTRRCNMNCAHCLRGNAENKDLLPETLHTVLRQTESVGELTFTGGEPTLNLPIIRETLRYCKKNHIPVYSFYLVTNGKKISQEFLMLMIEWYAYCVECGGDDESIGVALSKDKYHEPIDMHNEMMLKALGFYRPEDKHVDYNKYAPINLGKARSLPNTREDRTVFDEIDVTEENGYLRVSDRTILITTEGDILAECDYEYSDPDSVWICRAENASATFKKIMSNPSFNWKKQKRA